MGVPSMHLLWEGSTRAPVSHARREAPSVRRAPRSTQQAPASWTRPQWRQKPCDRVARRIPKERSTGLTSGQRVSRACRLSEDPGWLSRRKDEEREGGRGRGKRFLFLCPFP